MWSGVTIGLIFCPFDGPIGEVTTGSTSLYYWQQLLYKLQIGYYLQYRLQYQY